MAVRKSPKKVYKKGATRAQTARSKQSKMISFFVGVITVIVVGLLIFQYTQTNNYKHILGAKTQVENTR